MASEGERICEAYLTMAKEVPYRPQAPSDGFGNIQLSNKELDDPERLVKEAVAYAKRFIGEENELAFCIGVSNYQTNRALVYVIEAARCLCGGADDVAVTLLKMARDEIAGAVRADA
jgi:hypothetical protein